MPISDWIHMSTFRKAIYSTAWFALEDIGAKYRVRICLYSNNSDYDNTSNAVMVDSEANKKYETKIETLIKSILYKQIFTAKRRFAYLL